jgi:hypothetical protein
MSDLRELTDAELDLVSGGLMNPKTDSDPMPRADHS